MIQWYHRHAFEQGLGVGDRQGSFGITELDMTEQLN